MKTENSQQFLRKMPGASEKHKLYLTKNKKRLRKCREIPMNLG